MKISPFKLEDYFAKYEFVANYLLSCSDCISLTLKEVLAYADEDALKLWDSLKLGYTETQGHPLLREEVAKLYSTISAKEVLVAAPEEGIFITMNTLLNKGDHVITTFPAYQSLYEIANSIGCEVTHWKPQNSPEWNFDIETLKSLIQERTKLIVFNFPHNPTGATLTKEEIHEVVQLARKHNITIFSDEMYRFLEHDPSCNTESVSDLYENAISLFGMSKTFALPGLRIGWLSTQNQGWLKAFESFKNYTTICNNAPSEILALIALRARQPIIERSLGIIQNNLQEANRFFEKFSDLFEWHPPKAGPITFPLYKGNQRISDFCYDLVEKKGVLLVPSSLFDYEGNYFRIGLGREKMAEGLHHLESYLTA